ncbi:alanine--glyoxylate aminotransferase family protein [Chryseomicrobium sp. FSL W7-1435]|uniref:pyridoxal-phosphate-dependent aminotransferase family protein n=1 Tax=Chryseomicrobium sp. FSL W7-1435 TaxID=2921704 RepID=UPI003159A983
MLQNQTILRIPGPTPIPPSVQRAMQQPMIGHRDPETAELLKSIQPGMQQIFGTKQVVSVVAGSGTSGLEAAVVNTVAPGDKVIVCVTGAFGERFAAICKSYQIETIILEEVWGEPVNPKKLEQLLHENPDSAAVFITYCETSTSVLNPIAELSELIHSQSNALVIVDGVSCIGGVELEMDQWKLDVVVTGSQKAFMLPGGLMFVAFSDDARQKMNANPRPRFYLDLLKYEKAAQEFSTPFTPATSLLYGLQEVMQLMKEETLESVFKRHLQLRDMTRAALRALNLELLAGDAFASPTVTAFLTPGIEAKQVRKQLSERFGIRIAGGQGHQKDTVLRIGHMGYCSATDVLLIISALEVVLTDLGHVFEAGQGTVAAQKALIGGNVHV